MAKIFQPVVKLTILHGLQRKCRIKRMSMSKAVFQPAGNYYDKYRTRNPIARWLMDGFLSSFDTLIAGVGSELRQAIEIGCGEGELSIRLARSGVHVAACDIAADAIAEARVRAAGLDIPFFECPIEQARDSFSPDDLVVCCGG